VDKAIEELERAFADWVGASGTVAVGFGRTALLLALEAAGVEGGEVAVPNFICAQVPEAVRRARGRPVFYPVRSDLGVSAEEFHAVLGRGTRAAIAVHYFGRVLAEISELARICRESGVILIEDCALAFGASSNGRRAGSFGELAIFSFTKSDWCYGGGIVTAASPVLAARLREASRGRNNEGQLRPARGLLLKYGVLRRADFAANRPSRSRLAAFAGRSVERILGFGGGNFYDRGRFDSQMSSFAARRALHLLADCDRQIRQRQAIVRELQEALHGAEHVLGRSLLEPGETAAFLVLRSPAGRAAEWVGDSDRAGVTLRLTWPAYQAGEVEVSSHDLARLAQQLVILEIHPQLSSREVNRIGDTLKRLGAAE
jgi:dTDP-4-amino-4,6-dideoxygalactose transaminase